MAAIVVESGDDEFLDEVRIVLHEIVVQLADVVLRKDVFEYAFKHSLENLDEIQMITHAVRCLNHKRNRTSVDCERTGVLVRFRALSWKRVHSNRSTPSHILPNSQNVPT